MYLFQDFNNIGNISLRSIWIFDLVSCVTVKNMLVHLVYCCKLVNAIPLLVFYMCLSCAEIDSVRYIFMF